MNAEVLVSERPRPWSTWWRRLRQHGACSVDVSRRVARVALPVHDAAVVDDYSGGPVGLPGEGDVVVSSAELDGLSGLEMLDGVARGPEVGGCDGDLFGCCHGSLQDSCGMRLEDTLSRRDRHTSRGVSRTHDRAAAA
jgi:hypothetical protein